MKSRNILFLSLFISSTSFSQNVGINSTGAAPVTSAALDVDMANKGILIPRVALTTTTAFAPVTGTATTSLLVFNTATAGVAPNNVVPGYYYWDNTLTRWIRMMVGGVNDYWITGASAATVNNPVSTGFLGTSNNNHVDLVTNGVVRGRLSNLGEFFIGTTATALAGDLMNGVSNATFPWAINGYSSQNGAGVYGQIQSGTTIFAGVQGEYNGTGAQGSGVRGLYLTATAGTSFAAVPTGVFGDATSTGSYKFGVYGTGGTSTRSGGVMGYDYGITGALGYFANSGLDYSVYGFGTAYFTGAAGGKGEKSNSILPDVNTNIGIGIYGGMMGGWFRGLAYGTHVKGEIYSMYVDGKTYTNAPITQLIETENNNRQPVYSTSSMKVEISDRGKSNLNAGEMYVPFSQEFKNTISADPNELTITVSPMGNSNGVYIASYDANGFTVKENNSGASNVAFTWIAIGTRKNYETMSHDAQILDKTFDQKMEGVMYNDNNTTGTPQTMWWDGTQMRFDVPPPAKQADPNYIDASRPKAKAVTTAPSSTIQE